VDTRTAISVVLTGVAALGCSPPGPPTPLTVPESATQVQQLDFLQGRAHQTDFRLKARYPDTRALDHYLKTIGAPWVRCDWVPEWQSFLDGTATPVRTVHQQMHMWVNREERRTLMLSMRYHSPSDCAPDPLNDDQQVVLVEYLGVDVDDTIQQLKLTCPGREVRSNSTQHADAREAPRAASRCGARAGERGR
jgi:hypothetical protein